MIMRCLDNLSPKKKVRRKRVGRGPGSGMGKTSCRGVKGAGSRSGWKARLTYEGGQMRLFQHMPRRGFTRGRFLKRLAIVNLADIERVFSDGESVNQESLRKHRLIGPAPHGVKLLAKGELSKKISSIEVDALSKEARNKVEALGITIHHSEGHHD